MAVTEKKELTECRCVICGRVIVGSKNEYPQPKLLAKKNQWYHFGNGRWMCPKCKEYGY